MREAGIVLEATETDEFGFMPPEVSQAYEVWLGPAMRSPTETARLLGIPKPRVANWVHRHSWHQRALSDDLESRDGAVAAARASMARLLTKAVEVAELTLDARLDAQGKPPPGAPTPSASKHAFATLAIFGVSAQKHVTVEVEAEHALGVSRDELDAYLQALLDLGDTATMLALSQGRGDPSPHEMREVIAAANAARGREARALPNGDTGDADGALVSGPNGHAEPERAPE
jgi:hypothetical protein